MCDNQFYSSLKKLKRTEVSYLGRDSGSRAAIGSHMLPKYVAFHCVPVGMWHCHCLVSGKVTHARMFKEQRWIDPAGNWIPRSKGARVGPQPPGVQAWSFRTKDSCLSQGLPPAEKHPASLPFFCIHSPSSSGHAEGLSFLLRTHSALFSRPLPAVCV